MSDLITQFQHVLGHRLIRDGQADVLTDGYSDADGLHTHASKATRPVPRSDLATEGLLRHQVPLRLVARPDGNAVSTVFGASWFALQAGGWGSGTLWLVGNPTKSTTTTSTLLFEFVLPPEFIAAGNSRLAVSAKVGGVGTPGVKTIDAQVYKLNDDGSAGSDLCTTAAQTTTTSYADYAFAFTDSGLVAGDRLMVLVQMVVEETGGAENCYNYVANIEMQLDTKG